MRLKEKDKKEIKTAIYSMLDEYDDAIICMTEKHITWAGTPIELLGLTCQLIEHLGNGTNLTREIIKDSINKVI